MDVVVVGNSRTCTGFTLTDKVNTRLSAHAVYVCIINTLHSTGDFTSNSSVPGRSWVGKPAIIKFCSASLNMNGLYPIAGSAVISYHSCISGSASGATSPSGVVTDRSLLSSVASSTALFAGSLPGSSTVSLTSPRRQAGPPGWSKM